DIDCPHLIWIAGAALRRGCEDDGVPHVQRIRLPVGPAEWNRRRGLFAIGQIDGMKLAVACEGINRSRAGSIRGADQRCCRLSAWTKGIGGAAVSCRRRIFKMFLPEDLSLIRIDRIDIVGYAGLERDLFDAAGGVDLADHESR